MNPRCNSVFAAPLGALTGWLCTLLCALLCSLILLGAVPAMAACTPVPAGLTSWWPGQNNANDIVGSNNGTLQGGATFATGKVGQAFSLDGVDDYVDIGGLSELQGATGLTVLAWVNKTDDVNAVAGFVGKWDTLGSANNTFLLYNGEGGGAGKGGFVVQFDNDTLGAVGAGTTIPTNQWVLVAATWRSSDGAIAIYKNGVADGSAVFGAGRTLKYHTAYPAEIGDWGVPHGQAYRFKGLIDEPMIFNRALSQSQIQAIFNAGTAGLCQSDLARVTNTNNSGSGSLRGAIHYANSQPGTTISFAVPGPVPAAGVFTISPTSQLPAITADGTKILGSTQAATTGQTGTQGPEIYLNGASAGPSANGLTINAANCEVQGLMIARFGNFGIPFESGGHGVLIQNSTATGNVVRGCVIGLGPDGTAQGNRGDGVRLEYAATSNVIGGTTAASRNVLSGNHYGISLDNSFYNVVQGNYIGTNVNGTPNRGNVFSGVEIFSGFANTIGAAPTGDPNVGGNRIAGNGLNTSHKGVRVGASSSGNSIRGNAIFGNGTIGIDLFVNTEPADGVTANDSGDGDGGPNGLQNFPVLTSATTSGATTIINGTLNSLANTSFVLDFYRNTAADASGYGEGEAYIGSVNVTTDNSGNATFNKSVSGSFGGQFITATATNLNFGDTSEFSQGRLTDDGAAPTLAVGDQRALLEGSAAAPGSTTFAVRLSAPSGNTVTVKYATQDGTALSGSDYTAKSGTLTFAPGETLKSVKVNFIGESVAELNETLFLGINTPTNATIADSRGSAYIKNDDGPSIAIANAVAVFEGNSGTAPQTFAVTLSASSTNTVTVDWATANNTAGPADYTAANGTLTFSPGQTSKTITVQVKGDTTVEVTETYRVNLSNPKYAVIADSQGVGYIKNDDGAGSVADEPSQ